MDWWSHCFVVWLILGIHWFFNFLSCLPLFLLLKWFFRSVKIAVHNTAEFFLLLLAVSLWYIWTVNKKVYRGRGAGCVTSSSLGKLNFCPTTCRNECFKKAPCICLTLQTCLWGFTVHAKLKLCCLYCFTFLFLLIPSSITGFLINVRLKVWLLKRRSYSHHGPSGIKIHHCNWLKLHQIEENPIIMLIKINKKSLFGAERLNYTSKQTLALIFNKHLMTQLNH